MSDLPLHPRLVHLPLGLAVALPLASLALVLLDGPAQVGAGSWKVVTGLQGLLVVSCLGALRSGELARARVKPLLTPGVLCGHRRQSRMFFLSSAATLMAMVLTMLVSAPARAGAACASVALGGISLLLGARAGRSGGEIVYTHGAAQAYARAEGT